MTGLHRAHGRKSPEPVASQAAPLPADDFAEPPDDPRWAADLNATQPWEGPAPEPPVAVSPEPVTVPDAPEVIAPTGPIRHRADSVALDREVADLLAGAEKALSVAAAERVLRHEQDAASRGRAALLAWAADGSASALEATRPYAMTAAAERPEEQQ